MRDVYSTFHDLAAHNTDGRDYRITLLNRGAPVTIIAPHAGGIEPGTSEISCAIAGEDFNCYLFEGLRTDSNSDLHLTSTHFDEPQGLRLIRNSLYIITVHGCEGDETETRVGGLDIATRDRLIRLLCQAGFNANTGHGNLSGSLATNLCNMGCAGRGVQLEFPTGLRRLLFQNLNSRNGRQVVTPTFSTLIRTIRAEYLRT